jgi:hypothetical protein
MQLIKLARGSVWSLLGLSKHLQDTIKRIAQTLRRERAASPSPCCNVPDGYIVSAADWSQNASSQFKLDASAKHAVGSA